MREQVPALLAVAAGGIIGALARHGIAVTAGAAQDGFPWATFGINVLGCLLIGALMALPEKGLRRPFLGTGVLGGFTTFSGYAVETERLLTSGHLLTAGLYVFGTLLAALAAVALGARLAR
ncbi:CrcB family protein [Allokutzneria sp. A3M-2-11 16]|uniref:FluC/FEX family fluoride channel n=1 Tax=Allokutzneria sp. A3M-2-11 16 TaxID=2962043 RepID=UPI0020B77DC2|nr:CrcB family protein [Allokutzneria sp. A3M-2-11 16]MCP3799049.1 CrcB family protein [Allokutzneria sp. A3M-2-11 16]